MAHVVCAKLGLVALLAEAGRRGHDTGVQHQDVQALLCSHELPRGCLDGGQGGEVAVDVCARSSALGKTVWMSWMAEAALSGERDAR